LNTLDTLKQEVAEEKTVEQSAVALLNGLSQEVANLEPNQAAIDQLAADIKSQSDELAAAVAANTPAQASTGNTGTGSSDTGSTGSGGGGSDTGTGTGTGQ